jgi:hypothetical protein
LITHVRKPFIDAILREGPAVNAAIGWALVAAAAAAGCVAYGWRGVALAVTATVFWLLLQFSRALRVLRDAGRNPVGQVASAVMFNARLQRGMRLPDVLKITRSLGRQRFSSGAPASETWAWADAGGVEVQVHLRNGRVSAWELKRPDA